MSLIRDILLDIEALETPSSKVYFLEGADQTFFNHNMELMLDKGLIEAKRWDTYQSKNFAMVRLTWEGADFLDAVRDPEVWRKTQEGVKAVGSFSFDLMKALAKGFVQKQIEKQTGIDLKI
ncbi:MAG TPA: hypothetical protein DEP91_06180 [Sphingomonas bacterium]|jgi:hypothetical protein|uniref:DUF2513 domain-containing protein n=1 Tax=Sphingomonas bacterium TaxID=1895847 RepID=A0A3D0WCM3_9SPHN|nr:hypothetical protein [Sphingomonas bacterium]